jgi:hypothetical protein
MFEKAGLGLAGQNGGWAPTSSGSEDVGNLWMMMLSTEHTVVNSREHHVAVRNDPISVELRKPTTYPEEGISLGIDSRFRNQLGSSWNQL